jgi:hypothetical protein
MSNMGGQAAAAPDAPVVDTAEKVHISSLALLKMLKHGKLLLTMASILLYVQMEHVNFMMHLRYRYPHFACSIIVSTVCWRDFPSSVPFANIT